MGEASTRGVQISQVSQVQTIEKDFYNQTLARQNSHQKKHLHFVGQGLYHEFYATTPVFLAKYFLRHCLKEGAIRDCKV